MGGAAGSRNQIQAFIDDPGVEEGWPECVTFMEWVTGIRVTPLTLLPESFRTGGFASSARRTAPEIGWVLQLQAAAVGFADNRGLSTRQSNSRRASHLPRRNQTSQTK